MCEPQRGDRRWLTPFANLLTRVIFSTKDRQPLLTPDLRTALLAYMGGIVRNFHGKLIDSYTWE